MCHLDWHIMSAIQTPPRPPEVDNDTDAGVIDDARARQSKQRRAGAAAVLVAAAIAAPLLLAFGGGGGRSGGGQASNGSGGEPGRFASHIVIGAPGAATAAEIAAAMSGCENSSIAPAYVSPGQRVVLAQASARYTALISIAYGHAFECLYGHPGRLYGPRVFGKLHAFVWNDLGSTGTAPAADKLIARVSFQGGGGSVVPQFRHVNMRLLRKHAHKRHPRITRAELVRATRLANGAYFGDYTLGQAGKAVTAVRVRFADGAIVDATVRNGWYFVWWPWFANPTSIEVVTKSGTETSPMTGTGMSSAVAVPRCRPDTHGCVFQRT